MLQMNSFLQIVLVLSSLVLFYYLVKLLKYYRSFMKIPGPPYDLLLRHEVNEFHSDYRSLLDFKHKWHSKHPRVCRFFLGPFGYVSLAHPESIKELVSLKLPKNFYYRLTLSPWIGEGLLVSSGKKWFRNRRMLTQAFHFETIHSFMPIYIKCTNVMLSQWEKTPQQEGYIVLQDFISYLTLDVLLQCICSLETNCQLDKGSLEYVRDIHELTRLIWLRYAGFRNLLDIYFYNTEDGRNYKRVCKSAKNFTYDIILQRKKALQKNNSQFDINIPQHKDFLNILLTATDESGNSLTDEEICDEVNTFVFEGHDTTAVGITWVLYYLAKYPEYQEMCRDEIIENTSGDVKLEDFPNLMFLTMFIKESLRIRPPVHSIGRETIGPETIQGYPLPNGTVTQISIIQLHWNPEVWPEPFKFDPYRFSPENIDKIHPYAYIPFAVGERNCIGQNMALHEIKTVACLLLKRYKLSLHPSLLHSEIEIKKDVLLKPSTPIKLIIEQLDNPLC